ncbi:embryonic polarity protein dorsal-like [Bactrocera oleae]|uniref:embryonic polarity protein dorsal-like n=1 Tax=Bactrocera oleae TaxID=104688 RepID=UPI00387E9481
MDSDIYMNQFNDLLDEISPSMSQFERFKQEKRQTPPCADITLQKPNQKQKRKQKPKQKQTQETAVLKKKFAEPNRNYKNAYVKIVEQPASKAVRFRYECEGRSAGSIPGENSTLEMRTYPTIEIVGYKGRSVCVVSCVSKDPPYRPHPHTLVGKEGCKSGVYTFSINENTMRAELCNLGIQCVKKKDIEASLKVREEIRVDPFKTGFSHVTQPSSIDINAVRLCFQVFIQGENGHFTVPLKPVVTDPIYDKKSKSDLVIREMCSSATVLGNTTIMLLCEKVAKEDIAVRFFEEINGVVVWQAYGDFEPSSVHKQTAIRLRTPKYHNTDIEEPVQIFVQLQRPSDGAVSKPCEFKYEPDKKSRLKRKCRLNDLTMASFKARENQTVTNKPLQNNIIKNEAHINLDTFFVSSEMTPSPEPLSPLSSIKSNTSRTPSPDGKVTEVVNLESGMANVGETLNAETIPTTLENHEESKVYLDDQQSQFSKVENIQDQQQQPQLNELLPQPNRTQIQQQQSQKQSQQGQHQCIPPQLQVWKQLLRPNLLQQQQPQQPLPPQPIKMPMHQQRAPQQPQLQQQQHLRLMQQLQQPFLGNPEIMNWDEKFASILAFATAALSNNPFNLQQFLNATASTMAQNGQYNSALGNPQQMPPPPPPQQQHQFLSQQQPPQQQVNSSQTQFQQQSNVATSINDDTLVGDDDSKNISGPEAPVEASSISHLLNLDSDQLVQICDDTLLEHTITEDFELASLTLSV